MHEAALLLDQARVEAPPAAIATGFAVKVTVGVGSGVTALTVICTEAAVVPPTPVQVSE